MNEDKIKELRAHAGKLVADGKSLSGVFEFLFTDVKGAEWMTWKNSREIPDFLSTIRLWRIAQPKKQLIDWSHPYFKGCATNYGELFAPTHNDYANASQGTAFKSALRLATPANEDSNWCYFRSTPENDAKLLELAKMVKVEVRYWCDFGVYRTHGLDRFQPHYFSHISNYRITGLQDGWTDNPEEAQSC